MKILFIPSTNPSVKLMSGLAAWFSGRGHEAVLVANVDQQHYLQSLGAAGHTVLDFKTLQPVASNAKQVSTEKGGASSPLPKAKAASRKVRWLERLHRANHSVVIAILAIYWMLQILRFRRLWRQRVTALGCRVAFVWGDNAGTTNGELLNLLKSQGAQIVHLPIALTDQNIIAKLRVGSDVLRLGRNTAWLTKRLANLYPSQIYQFEGAEVFYFHPAEVLAMNFLGVLPSRPWVLGASRADLVCLVDDGQKQYWTQRGLDEAKVRLIGNLDIQNIGQDIVCLGSRYPALFQNKSPLVLINMPNLVEHNVLKDWSEFWPEVDNIFKPFIGENVELVVNLHPKADRANYAQLTNTYKCSVSQGDIAAWIGLADLYVSLCSSTETIAAQFGVPILDIGPIYGFESEVLRGMAGIQFFSHYESYGDHAKEWRLNWSGTPRRLGLLHDGGANGAKKPYDAIAQLLEDEASL